MTAHSSFLIRIQCFGTCGMTIRYRLQEMMDASVAIADIIAKARGAREAFDQSRRIKPDNQHAYISEVQLLCRVLDYAAKVAKTDAKRLVHWPDVDPFLRESFEAAEDIM